MTSVWRVWVRVRLGGICRGELTRGDFRSTDKILFAFFVFIILNNNTLCERQL